MFTPREHALHKILWLLLRPILAGIIVVGVLYWPMWYLQKALGVLPAQAHTVDDYLHFGPLPTLPITLKLVTPDYKKVRAGEICQMAKDAGVGQYCTQLIAHLLRECGSMTEYCDWTPGKASNDHGWAVGLAQWHIWYRYRAWAIQNHFAYNYNIANVTAMRDQFFKDFPEMTDWRSQAHKYITEMSGCVGDGYSIWHCIDTWNANPDYLHQVKSQLANAEQLLSPL